MVLNLGEIYFKNSNSKCNQELCRFFDRNIESIIIKTSTKFKFKIATESDISKLLKRGIKQLPVMLLNGREYISVPEIIKVLKNNVNNSKTTAVPKDETEVLNEYLRSAAMENVTKDSEGKMKVSSNEDEDEDEKLRNTLQQSLLIETARRGMTQKNGDNVYTKPPPKPSRNMDMDDDFTNRADSIDNHNSNRIKREDNLSDDLAILRSLNRGGESNQDDDMMATLLGRIGTDE